LILKNLQCVFLPNAQEPVFRPNDDLRDLIRLNASHLKTIINPEICEIQEIEFRVLHELAFDWSSGFPSLNIPVCPSVKILSVRKMDDDDLTVDGMFQQLGKAFPNVEVFSFLLKYGSSIYSSHPRPARH
jgi:hypothetical protein